MLAARRRMFGEDHLTTLVSLNNLAGLLQAQNRQEEAAACFREVVEKRRRILGDVHPRTLNAIKNLGTVLGKVGKRKEAEALMRESLENQRRLLGADHPGTLVSLSNLAVFLVDEKRLDEAEPMCRDALERRRRVLGENHKDTMASYNIMGYVLMNQDREAEAEPFVRQTLAICRRVLGPDHPDSFLYAHNLAVLLLNQVDVAALRGPAEHGRSDEQNAAAEAAQNRLTEVEQLLRGVIEDGRRAIGAEHAIVLSAARRLGGTLLEQVRFADARDVLAAVEPAARKAYQGAQQRSLALVIRNLGRAQVGLGEFAAAEPNLIEAQEIFERLDGAAHPNTRYCSEQLIELYQRWHTAEPDRGLDARLTQWQQRLDAAMASTQPTSQPQSPP
ncbi:MAG: tetratricopeptide repeat protein [Planctomycetia bacterium]|nr:MAG: tetratricopeptide repeat protein [Planctomycetia bacterium]